MLRPPSLIGQAVGGAYLCEEWELRITERCLEDDLRRSPGESFSAVEGVEIVKALVRDRKSRTHDTRQISPLTTGHEVWVLSRGHDHRGGTWFDATEKVVWLLASRRHRSGAQDDFFPYCRELDAEDRLMPTAADYRRVFVERDRWFVEALRIEAPLIVKRAREAPGAIECRLGGDYEVVVSVEVEPELGAEALTIALRADTIVPGRVEPLLAAFHAHPADWHLVDRLSSRALRTDEVAWSCTRVLHPV